ncbi:MAG TPA: divalent-cation tolerance protein CutA [Chitinophagales bacterium]|nr:divalent-cation tolerance protein CutA [Chitinophagales bacterium]HRK28699.1 divalent-cation tolerance protein CutA [Chitinophagales bacterium]
MPIIAVYITHANTEQAQKLVQALLQKRLIACANIFPIQSAYFWQGEQVNDSEVVSLVKTRTEYWQPLMEAVKQLHPYQTPCILRFDVNANPDYEQWIYTETAQAAITS